MQKILVPFIIILALLTSIAMPKSHAMMMDVTETQTSNNDHCQEMVMEHQKSAQDIQKAFLDCCDDCQCLMASCSYLSPSSLADKALRTTLRSLLISLTQSPYSDPTQDFFIPPKIS